VKSGAPEVKHFLLHPISYQGMKCTRDNDIRVYRCQ